MKVNPNDEGAWVFVSHSHKDIVLVREIRNELERYGHKPLMFYLKCLEDDSAELPHLLGKEIEARTWFVLCDSPNSRRSRWAQEEKDIVKSLPDKVYKEVDISGDSALIRRRVAGLAKRATVFISYSIKDKSISEIIAGSLRRADFHVFMDLSSVQAGSDWSTQTKRAIEQAVDRGFVLMLLSPDSFASFFDAQEVLYALGKAQQSNKSNIIPVILRNKSAVVSTIPGSLKAIQYFDFTEGNQEKHTSADCQLKEKGNGGIFPGCDKKTKT